MVVPMKLLTGIKYQVLELYQYQTNITGYEGGTRFVWIHKDGTLVIHVGFASDGPTRPALVTHKTIRGGMIHDALYDLLREGVIPQNCREIADKILEDVLREDGVEHWQAEVWEWAVQKCAAKCATPAGRPRVITVP